jgi:trans-aconitate methyltransferase
VWQKLTAGLAELGLAEPSSGTLREARQRLGSAPLRALFDLLRGPGATTASHAVRWRGPLLTAIDGTVMSIADADAIRARYPK